MIDLRVPLGYLFVIFGVILVYAGATLPAEMHRQSLGININLWWGATLLVFGGVMLLLARGGRASTR